MRAASPASSCASAGNDPRDDLATIAAVRNAVGEDIQLMVDFNQGLHLGEALHRCHMIDDLGLAWIEEPIVYDDLDGCAKLAAELRTPLQIGENFYGPRELLKALQHKACDLVMPDFMRIGGSRAGFALPPLPERQECRCPPTYIRKSRPT